MARKYSKVSFFSGCGGSSTGFHNVKNSDGSSAFDELLAVEIEKHSVLSFNLNHPNVPITNLIEYRDENKGFGAFEKFAVGSTIPTGDEEGKKLSWNHYVEYAQGLAARMGLKEHDANLMYDLDLLAASPPCQDFSTANGKRAEIDVFASEKNGLFFETIRLINEAQPKVFTIENVPGMKLGKMKSAFLKILIELQKTGYNFAYKTLYCPDYDIPQTRNRVIFIGVRKDLAEMGFVPVFPQKQAINEKKLILRNLLSDNEPDKIPYFFNSMQFAKQWIRATENICHTITKTPGMKFYNEKRDRSFDPSVQDIQKICTFPLDYKFYRADGASDKTYLKDSWARMGNAVPPKLMEEIGRTIKEQILDPYYKALKK